MAGKKRRLAVIGTAGGVLLGGAALVGGIAMAQTPSPGANPPGTPSAAQQQQRQAQEDQFLNDLAKNLGVDRSKLDGALKATETQEIDAAVQSGKLTQSQGTQIKQAIANGTEPLEFGPFGGPGGPGGFHVQLPANVTQAAQDALSKALGGETQDQVRADLQSGKTPDQIAQAHGTTVQAVNNAVVAAVQPLLDQAVQQGTLTATQEQDVLNGIKNGRGFGLGFHGGPPPGGPGPRGGNGANAPQRTATPGTSQ